jgi:hypothetical protein
MRRTSDWRASRKPCYTVSLAADRCRTGVNMRLFLVVFVVFAALALGGCPVFTRGAGEGRPIVDGQGGQQQ